MNILYQVSISTQLLISRLIKKSEIRKLERKKKKKHIYFLLFNDYYILS